MAKNVKTKDSPMINEGNGNAPEKKKEAKLSIAKNTNLFVLVAVAVAIFVLLNLLAQLIPNIDSTTGGIFTLTDITRKTLSELDADVTIYALYDRVEGEAETGPGKRAEQIAILDLYDAYPRITVKYVDLDRNPSFLKNTVGESAAQNYKKNDFIVKSGDSLRHITSSEIYVTETQTYNYFYQYEITNGIQAETKFTSAIIKVTGESPAIYYSTGFGEAARSKYSSILSYIENSGFDVNDIDLRSTEIPEDAVCIMFFGPSSDLTGNARDSLIRWLQKGHSAFFFMDIKSLKDDSIIYNSFPNFGEVLAYYGIALENTIVEESGDRMVSGSGSDIIFKTETRAYGALEKISAKQEFYVMNTRSLDLDNMKDTVEAEAIVQTTKDAKAVSIESENSSRTGISVIGASGKCYIGTATSRVVVFGSSSTFSDMFMSYFGSDAAQKITSECLRWMELETKANVADSIEAKEYNNGVKTAVVMADNTVNFFAVAVMIVIPLIILVAGFVIWIRRRHL